MLQEEHGVAVVEGGQQQAPGVGRGGGGDDLEPGHVAEPRLHVLAVERARAQPAPDGQPEHHGDGRSPAVVGLGQVVDDLVEAAGDEVAELHLDHGAEAVEGEAHGRSDGTGFDDRCVPYPGRSELGEEAVGGLEHASVLGDVLAEENDPLVGRRPQLLQVSDRLLGQDELGLALEDVRRRPGRHAAEHERGGGHPQAAQHERPDLDERLEHVPVARPGGPGRGGRRPRRLPHEEAEGP